MIFIKAVAVLFFSANISLYAQAETNSKKMEYPQVGIVKSVSGRVLINRFSEDGEKRLSTFDVKEGDVVQEKDEITTALDGLITIELKNNTVMQIAPNSVFKIYRHYVDKKDNQASSFNLLSGGVKASISKLLPESWVKLYTNNATIGVRGTEFVVDYSEEEKTTKIACFSGEVSVTPSLGESVGKDAQPVGGTVIVKSGEYAKIETLRENTSSIPVVTEKRALSDKVENSIKDSFTSDKVKASDWDFARISGSFFRFNFGYNLVMFSTPTTTATTTTTASAATRSSISNKYSSVHLDWTPLINVYSIIYLEPYAGAGLIKTNIIYLKAGANVLVHAFRGINIGMGGGVAGGLLVYGEPYSALPYSGYVKLIDFVLNYTFVNKKLGFIDGVSMVINHGFATEIYPALTSMELGIVLNFSKGRERW